MNYANRGSVSNIVFHKLNVLNLLNSYIIFNCINYRMDFSLHSGDVRVNQHPNMAVNTISFMRLHNILCDEFKRLNPKWNDEKIYQEARRLVIAMYQHVTYNEFLPVILGR